MNWIASGQMRENASVSQTLVIIYAVFATCQADIFRDYVFDPTILRLVAIVQRASSEACVSVER